MLTYGQKHRAYPFLQRHTSKICEGRIDSSVKLSQGDELVTSNVTFSLHT